MRLEAPQRPSYPGGAEVWVDDITSRADGEQASWRTWADHAPVGEVDPA